MRLPPFITIQFMLQLQLWLLTPYLQIAISRSHKCVTLYDIILKIKAEHPFSWKFVSILNKKLI